MVPIDGHRIIEVQEDTEERGRKQEGGGRLEGGVNGGEVWTAGRADQFVQYSLNHNIYTIIIEFCFKNR